MLKELNAKQKGLLLNWVQVANKTSSKVIGADDLTIEQYQRLTDINDFGSFEKEVNDYIHHCNLVRL